MMGIEAFLLLGIGIYLLYASNSQKDFIMKATLFFASLVFVLISIYAYSETTLTNTYAQYVYANGILENITTTYTYTTTYPLVQSGYGYLFIALIFLYAFVFFLRIIQNLRG